MRGKALSADHRGSSTSSTKRPRSGRRKLRSSLLPATARNRNSRFARDIVLNGGGPRAASQTLFENGSAKLFAQPPGQSDATGPRAEGNFDR